MNMILPAGTITKVDPDPRFLPVSDGVYSLMTGGKSPALSEAEAVRKMAMLVAPPEDPSPEQCLPLRIRAAWRIVREQCRMQGLIAADETLEEILSEGMAMQRAWIYPVVGDGDRYQTAGTEEALNEYRKLPIEEMPVEWAMAELKADPSIEILLPPRGMPLLPPSPPAKFRDRQDFLLLPGYKVEEDRLLRLWCQYQEKIAERRGVRRAAEAHGMGVDAGRLGMKDLLEPSTVREMYPSAPMIMEYESFMISQTLKSLSMDGAPATYELLKRKQGLDEVEAQELVKMAKQLAVTRTEAEKEQDRAMMIYRFEDYLQRCRLAMDTRGEILALKHLSQILGVTHHREDNDLNKTMINVINNVHSAEDAEERNSVKIISSHNPIDNDAMLRIASSME